LLDSAVSANEYYDRSPLLFWAVIYVSARHCEDEPSMLIILTEPLKKLLWQTISTPPHTWYQVQGILLCCVWPIPTSSLSTDNTLKLVTMAQTIAIQLGLHRPEVIQDFSRTKRRLNVSEISEVARTWSVCYFAGQK
jgi:transcriptional regulatory protein LEU3